MSKSNLEQSLHRFSKMIAPPTAASLIGLGALTGLCFAPYFLWPLLALIYGAVFYAVSQASLPKQAFKAGWWFGVGMYLGCFYWLYAPAYHLIAQGVGEGGAWWLHAAALTVMLIFMFSLAAPLGTMCWVFAKLRRHFPEIVWPWVFALCIVCAEYLRGFPFWPFLPWNLTGYALAGNEPLIQAAAIGGAGFVSWLALGVAASFSSLSHARPASIILFVWFALGLTYVETRPLPSSDADYHIRLVQAETAYEDSFSKEGKRKSFLTHQSVSKDPAMHTPNIILWPEGAVRYVLADEPFLIELLNAFEAEMLFGAFEKELRPYTAMVPHPNAPREMVEIELTEELFYNSIFYKAAGEDIALEDVVQKRVAVPVGEKMPLTAYFKALYDRYLPHFTAITVNADATPYINTSLGKMLVLNCYEALFSSIIWRDAAKADILLHMTNDAWYQGSVAAEQFFYIARMRAVEAGKPLIRVSNTGVNGMFDAYGRILYRFAPQVLPMPNDMAVSREMLAPAPNLFIQGN